MNAHLKEAKEKVARLFEMADKGDLNTLEARIEVQTIVKKLRMGVGRAPDDDIDWVNNGGQW